MAKKAYIGVHGKGVNLVNTDDPVTAYTINGNYTIANKQVTICYTTTNGSYFWLNLTQPLVANKMYAFSFDCECEDDGIDVTWMVGNLSQNTFAFKNGRMVIPFSMPSDTSTRILIDDTDNKDDRASWAGKQIVCSNFMVEEYDPDGFARMVEKSYIGVTSNGVNLVNTTNPLKASGGNGNLTVLNNQMVINYAADKGCYFYVMLDQPLVANKAYILSFDCSGVEDGVLSEWRVENNVNYSLTLKNGKQSILFSPSTDIPTQLLMDDGNRVNVIGKEIILSNFRIEQYCPEGVARRIKKAYIGAYNDGVNLVNTEKPIASVVGNGNVSAVNNQIVFNYAVAKDTYFFLKLTETLLTGEYYTVSFDCSGVDDETQLTILIDNQSRNPMLLKNGRLSRTFTPHRDVVNQLLMDDASTWVNVVGKEIVLSNFSIERHYPEGVARLWYERNPYFIPANASRLVTADNKTFCLRGEE